MEVVRARALDEDREEDLEGDELPRDLLQRAEQPRHPPVLEEERPDHREAEGDEPFRGVDLMVKGRACVR